MPPYASEAEISDLSQMAELEVNCGSRLLSSTYLPCPHEPAVVLADSHPSPYLA